MKIIISGLGLCTAVTRDLAKENESDPNVLHDYLSNELVASNETPGLVEHLKAQKLPSESSSESETIETKIS